ncbi:RIO1 family-domain-containing protein, partial [Baffinella frigidus]
AAARQVLDPKTVEILEKLVKNGFLSALHGCISTGKEANVYHAFSSPTIDAKAACFGPQKRVGGIGEVAIKVFKTSILVFKDRDKYISGDFRFRKGYSKNPRKMVKMWAEKEFRNLNRLYTSGVRCPRPLLIKSHVLVMEFIGANGTAASKLKHADLDDQGWMDAYEETVAIMRALFQACKLIHGDLSEYNLLYYEGRVIVIDVSQSVSPDHPEALTFLQASPPPPSPPIS